jgi:hypothetical protein
MQHEQVYSEVLNLIDIARLNPHRATVETSKPAGRYPALLTHPRREQLALRCRF